MISLDLGLWRSGGTGFNPLALSPALWLDASDASTLYTDSGLTTLVSADGDPVGGWQDKSGNSKNATQSSGTNKPLFKTNQLNGKSSLRWDGVNDFLDLGNNFNFGSSQFSIFIVVKSNNTIEVPIFIKDTGGGGQNGIWIGKTADPGGYYSYFNGSSYFQIGYTGAYLSTWVRPSVVRNNTSTNGVQLYANGTATNTATDSRTLTNTNSLRIGQFSTGLYGKFSGDFAEILVFNTALSASNRGLIDSYLLSKWGV